MLYPISTFVYFVLYRIVGYRKAIVATNVNNSFPEKNDLERKKIISDFYRYISDLMVETVWAFSLTEKRVRARLNVENPEVLDQLYDENRSVILILAHYSSWELVLSALNIFIKHQSETIYIPLSNAEFDRQYLKMRTKFNSKMIPKRYFRDSFNEESGLRAIIFGADQSPSISKNIHWTTFLNQETAVAKGAEKYAKMYNMPVVYARLTPASRGKFNLHFTLITDTPTATSEGEITEKHTRMLEEQIRQRPAYWLWSHRRWKKKRQPTD